MYFPSLGLFGGGWGSYLPPFKRHGDAREIKIPCRQCLSCRLNRSSEWQTRLIHEGKRHSSKIFLTLTYDNENLPEFGSLQTRHLQLFIKRLRKAIAPIKIRYYACGEYGDTTRRAHYHAIIYGWEPSDGRFHSSSVSGDKLYVSSLLSQLWTSVIISTVQLMKAQWVMSPVTPLKTNGADRQRRL